VNIAELVGQFKRAAPGVPVQLEIITGRPPAPIPYLDAEYWQQYPKVPAADFARFVKLVKQGRPFAGTMLTAIPGKLAPEFQSAFREQERMDLERSVAYARGTLGLGLRGRG
jgi:3-oxoisoapionate decarboxylase